MKLFLIRLCRVMAAASAVFICAMPMVLYAEAYGSQVTGQESVFFRISGNDTEERHSQKVQVTVDADDMPNPPVTGVPTQHPTGVPTQSPTSVPTQRPTIAPTQEPTAVPTKEPTSVPTRTPTITPTKAPTAVPVIVPTSEPTKNPTRIPTKKASEH